MAAIAVKSAKLGAGLVARGLEGFRHRHEVELQPSGIAELDAVLGGAAQRQYSLRLRLVGFLSNLSWKNSSQWTPWRQDKVAIAQERPGVFQATPASAKRAA